MVENGSMTTPFFSRGQLVREASLTVADLAEVEKCRRNHNRLGFAYQVGFVRLFHRFPTQQPLEVCDELLHFVALQLGIAEDRIADYAPWQHTASEHQERIREYLNLTVYGPREADALERFIFEESVPSGAVGPAARSCPRVSQGAAYSVPRRVGATAASRGAEEAGT